MQNGTVLQAKTISNLHTLLSSILQAAVDDKDGLLNRNPCAKSRLPEIQREEQVYLEPGQFQAQLAATPAFFHCLPKFLLATGVSWGEAAGLAVKHLHLDPRMREPYVERAVAWRRQKGGRFVLGRVKSRCLQRRSGAAAAPEKRGPTAWMTQRTGASSNAGVMTADPGGHGATGRQASGNCGPAAV